MPFDIFKCRVYNKSREDNEENLVHFFKDVNLLDQNFRMAAVQVSCANRKVYAKNPALQWTTLHLPQA